MNETYKEETKTNDAEAKDEEKDTPHSHPFYAYRWSDYPELNNCISELVEEIENWEQETAKASGKRKNKRREDAEKKFRAAIRCLVIDLYVTWQNNPTDQVGVQLSRQSFEGASNKRYQASFLTYRTFIDAYKGLKKLDYINLAKKGHYDTIKKIGKTTKITATQKLISKLTDQGNLTLAKITHRTDDDKEECIVLRDRRKTSKKENTKAKDIEYEDDAFTNQARNNLNTINSVLSRHWIDLYLTNDEFKKAQEEMRNKHLKTSEEVHYIDFNRRTLRRIFNDGSFTQGGRFYGGFWQNIPKKYRKNIMIDGKPTIEIDYSAMHPAILYLKEGLDIPENPYSIDWKGTKRRCNFHPKLLKSFVKVGFNAMLNASKKPINAPNNFEANISGITQQEFLQRIIDVHKPIEKYFYKNWGKTLQFIDSQIAEQIMLHFAKGNYPCLPIHDSFIVQANLADDLKTQMLKASEKIVGKELSFKAKETILDWYGKPEYYDDDYDDADNIKIPEVHANITELLHPTGKYSGYHTRLNDWWKAKAEVNKFKTLNIHK